MEREFLQKIRAFMEEAHMAPVGCRIIAGVSGGADSVALLLALSELSGAMGFTLEVFHIEHGIRGEESRADARFTEELCARLCIPFTQETADVPGYAKAHHMGEEEAARLLRYEALCRRAETVIRETGKPVRAALAHHREDNAETALFRMARGSGARGMRGILPTAEYQGITVIRPLLRCCRAEIEEFLRERGQDYCTDSTNCDETYSRNRIRRRILPELQAVNPDAVRHINQLEEQMAVLYDYLGREAESAGAEIISRDETAVFLHTGKLLALHPAVRAEVVRLAVFEAAGARKDIAEVHVREVLALLERQPGKRVSLPYGITACLEQGALLLKKEEVKRRDPERNGVLLEITPDFLAECRKIPDGRRVPVGEDGAYLTFRLWENFEKIKEIPKKKYTKLFDYDKIKGSFLVRNRRQGDYFILNAQGNRKKLNRFLIDEKIPAHMRDQILLLAQGSEVIWMIGGRISENYKVTEETDWILEAVYQPKEGSSVCGMHYGGNCNGISKET